MAKYYGNIGFGDTIESPESPGIWEDVVIDRKYRGDIIKDRRSSQSNDGGGSNFLINSRISIVADSHAFTNYYNIRYVELHGSKWKVSNIEVARPRIIISLGGLYNEQSEAIETP